MGCIYSRVDKEETVRRCKERKKLIKQLVHCRCELAAAHLAYLQSLRNTGATLRQFAEDEFTLSSVGMPPSPLPLPPSPPPPPPFSPDSRKEGEDEKEKVRAVQEDVEKLALPNKEENLDINDGASECGLPPPPPILNSVWDDYWDPFGPPSSSKSSSPAPQKKSTEGGVASEAVEEEKWAETNTEFEEEEEEEDEEEEVGGEAGALVLMPPVSDKLHGRSDMFVDDNSSAVSWFTRDSEMAMVAWRSKKTLAGIAKELDDYFLKASAGGTEVVALVESNRRSHINQSPTSSGKSTKSAKVFSSLSWRWSSRSPLSSKDACVLQSDTCRSGSHCLTLDKLFAEEQKLYKEVKAEEISKLQLKKKNLLLHKLEGKEQDWTTTQKIRTSIEELQSQMRSLQESISGTCLSISKLRDEELYPQLIGLSTGLMQMWRTMYECHQVQNHIAQQANHLNSNPSTDPTTDSHRNATTQLEREVTFWYNAFHRLLKCQREYAHALNQWVRLTDCLPDNNEVLGVSSGVYALCEEWQLSLDRLPDKVTAEAIRSFMSVIHSIDLQLIEERNLQKKSAQLEKKLEKRMNSLEEVEKLHDSSGGNAAISGAQHSNKNALSKKHAKLDALKKQAEDAKTKYLNAVSISRAMTLNNLQTSLPNVFQAMMGFSCVCVQAFDSILRRSEMVTSNANGGSPL